MRPDVWIPERSPRSSATGSRASRPFTSFRPTARSPRSPARATSSSPPTMRTAPSIRRSHRRASGDPGLLGRGRFDHLARPAGRDPVRRRGCARRRGRGVGRDGHPRVPAPARRAHRWPAHRSLARGVAHRLGPGRCDGRAPRGRLDRHGGGGAPGALRCEGRPDRPTAATRRPDDGRPARDPADRRHRRQPPAAHPRDPRHRRRRVPRRDAGRRPAGQRLARPDRGHRSPHRRGPGPAASGPRST